MTFTLDQLARTSLLPESASAAIFSGKNPPLSDLIPHLVVGSMDADALTACDKNSTWTERRISRQLLGLTFLTAFLLDHIIGAENQNQSGAEVPQGKRA